MPSDHSRKVSALSEQGRGEVSIDRNKTQALCKVKDVLIRVRSINKVNGYKLDNRSSITGKGTTFVFTTTSNGLKVSHNLLHSGHEVPSPGVK